MSTALKRQALHGAFWSFTERFGLLIVQFTISIILARILTPEEFGLVAMITIFALLAQLIVTSGFGQALIQKKDCTHLDESTAFWVNILLGVLMTAALYLSAPWIARFYDEAELVPITRVASFNLLINSFSVVQNALLQKELLFKKRTVASLAGIVISGVVSVSMAFNGFGVWALVYQVLINNGIRTLTLWLVHSWRPLARFSRASFCALFKFGSNMLLSSMLNTVFDNIYLLIIGKIYSAADLGFYQKAKEFVIASSNSISLVISQVNFPVLSKLQHDPRQMRNAFTQVLRHALFVIIPVMVGIGVCAPNIIQVLLGDAWLPSTKYLRLLCIIGSLFPVHLLNLNILMAMGRSDLFLKLEVIKKALVTVGILITFRHGITALLFAHIASSVLSLLINTYYTKKLLSYGLDKQLRDNIKLILNSLTMGVIVYALGTWLPFCKSITLLAQISAGLTLFVIGAWFSKDPVFLEWLNYSILKEKAENITP